MHPWLLIAILEKTDPSFRELFYPKRYRCPLENRIVRAIDEHWPVYFPTRKECRGLNWSLTIPENEPLYKPHAKSRQKLEQWKNDIKGTVVEIRTYGADISWRRFLIICRRIPRLQFLLRDFEPLADFLIDEESMWPSYNSVNIFNGQMRALFSVGSPYHHADPNRLRFLHSNKPTIEKIRMIGLIRELFDRPLMILAVLQKCAAESRHSQFWLPIQNHVSAIIKTPSPITFRKTWLDHAMQVSGAITKTGKSCPRKWALKLISTEDPDLSVINAKAIELNGWLKGKKRPSMKNVVRAGQIILASSQLSPKQTEATEDLWLFSWMITLWLEKHFTEIVAEFKGDNRKIEHYYRRLSYYLETDLTCSGR